MKTDNENLIPQPRKVLGMKEYAEGDTLAVPPPPPPTTTPSSTLQRKKTQKRENFLKI